MLDNIQLPTSSNLVATGLVFATLYAIYNRDSLCKKVVKKLAPSTNAVIDMYLDRKYKNTEEILAAKPKPELKQYKLLSIELYQESNRLEPKIINVNPNIESFLENKCLDLNEGPNKIVCNKILAYIFDKCEFEFKYIYANLIYQYGDEKYSYYFKCTQDRQLSLPIYNTDDMDSCMRTEYTGIYIGSDIDTMSELKFGKLDGNICDEIIMAAGPKGNFYKDTEDHTSPVQINSLSKIMGNTDWLILTDSLLGEDLVYSKYDKLGPKD